ncbi:dihydrodipicolinate synthetase [Calycina marina]|uniref:Dihydrodipicolinate synthetase n=1 Tax=Calycina marina TaxID=1763456 RepID=A0A9P7YXB8_9HELO|nr:dihydrodipicolinate synthetase [Calycina marina]
MPQSHVPPRGIWCPAITFFDRQTDTLDLTSQKKYFKWLSTTGLTGLVILGTNSEAFLLSREERSTLIAAAREAVGPDFPLMAGVGAHSTSQVLTHIEDATSAGADYLLVLPPAYFGAATTPAVIKSFFKTVAAASKLPIVIYNFPGVCNGVDLSSELITDIANLSENVVGAKLTCGSVGKITRLSGTFSSDRFATFGGQSDFLLGGLMAGSAGCIAAFANVAPTTVVKVYELYKADEVEKALKLHQKAALAEGITRQSIGATKFAAAIRSAEAAGIEKASEKLEPRHPYEAPSFLVRALVVEAVEALEKFETDF